MAASSACVGYLYSNPLWLREQLREVSSPCMMSMETEVRGLRTDEVRRVLVLVLVLVVEEGKMVLVLLKRIRGQVYPASSWNVQSRCVAIKGSVLTTVVRTDILMTVVEEVQQAANIITISWVEMNTEIQPKLKRKFTRHGRLTPFVLQGRHGEGL